MNNEFQTHIYSNNTLIGDYTTAEPGTLRIFALKYSFKSNIIAGIVTPVEPIYTVAHDYTVDLKNHPVLAHKKYTQYLNVYKALGTWDIIVLCVNSIAEGQSINTFIYQHLWNNFHLRKIYAELLRSGGNWCAIARKNTQGTYDNITEKTDTGFDLALYYLTHSEFPFIDTAVWNQRFTDNFSDIDIKDFYTAYFDSIEIDDELSRFNEIQGNLLTDHYTTHPELAEADYEYALTEILEMGLQSKNAGITVLYNMCKFFSTYSIQNFLAKGTADRIDKLKTEYSRIKTIMLRYFG